MVATRLRGGGHRYSYGSEYGSENRSGYRHGLGGVVAGNDHGGKVLRSVLLTALMPLVMITVGVLLGALLLTGCKNKGDNGGLSERSFCTTASTHEMCQTGSSEDATGGQLTGQTRQLSGFQTCTDEIGTLGEADSAVKAGTQKEIFLRCIFHGGELSDCASLNNCQVLMDQDTCEQQLERFKSDYPEKAAEGTWSCSPI